MMKKLRQAYSRLSKISSPADLWSFVVRALYKASNKVFKSTRLEAYDLKLTGNFGKRMMDKYCKGSYYDFNGIYLPCPDEDDYGNIYALCITVNDTLGIYLYHDDDYSRCIVDKFDKTANEGSYFYKNEEKGIDITIHDGDVVFDLGAWIGEFSAYACAKGAIVYAFEPSKDNFKMLEKTVELNKHHKGRIHIIPYGVGARKGNVAFQENEKHMYASKFVTINSDLDAECESDDLNVKIVNLDDFVLEYGIKVDFIKADIEGFERYMLQGANNVLKTHQPTLSICTYHLPDDPELLKCLILSANPNYKIIQRGMKLFAYVDCR